MISIFETLATAPVTDSGNVVLEITKNFKVYWPLLISQFISFAIVIFLLKKFAFGPIQKMLEERRSRIADGEAKLIEIQRQLAESEKTTAAAIAKANEEAQRMVEEAKQGAILFSEQKSQEAISQAQAILTKAEAAAKADRDRLQTELKREFGRLIAATTSQVTGKVLTDDDQRRINEEALAKVEA
ncbi:MAG: ATP synthase F0 subunit B [Verrucomicrobia bacterium]|nr:MAG: ATP synthase F0 subunit B [Verrucomicrobiota bacterium]